MKYLFYLMFVGVTYTATGQSTLTVFSHETDFILYVNGERKNAEHSTNVKATGITADFVKLKLILKDSSTPEVSTSASLAPQDNAVFELKKNKKGKYVLRFVSGKIGSDDEAVANNESRTEETPVSQTKDEVLVKPGAKNEVTSTTSVQNVQAASISNAGVTVKSGTGNENISLTMTLNLPQEAATMQTTMTTTTTTTTSSTSTIEDDDQSGSHAHSGTVTKNESSLTNCSFSYLEFKDAVATIKGSSFADTQLSTAKQVIKKRCLTVEQSIEVLNIFSMEDTKLEFAKYVYDFISNKNQCYKTLNAFSFDSSKEEYNDYLESKK